MTASAGAAARSGPAARRRPVDVLYVSLGSTIGLRMADDQLVGALRAAGQDVEVVRPPLRGDVRTLMLTDLLQSLAVRRAVRDVLTRVDPARTIYSTTTAAMFWPRRGAIRFDALAQQTRPGRHGLWQRPLERRRLRQAPLLIPCAEASTDGAPAAALARPRVVVPIAIPELVAGDVAAAGTQPQTSTHASEALPDILAAAHGTPVAITYAADAQKKGLDRVLAAWAQARRPGEVLLVAGRDDLPSTLGPSDAVHLVGRLEPALFRALLRAVGVLVLAPRREDYGLVQLEALAEGAHVVTTTAPGPYAALPLIRDLWPEQVVDHADDPAALAAALRHAIDDRSSDDDPARAAAAVAPWSAAAVRTTVADALVPALGAAGS